MQWEALTVTRSHPQAPKAVIKTRTAKTGVRSRFICGFRFAPLPWSPILLPIEASAGQSSGALCATTLSPFYCRLLVCRRRTSPRPSPPWSSSPLPVVASSLPLVLCSPTRSSPPSSRPSGVATTPHRPRASPPPRLPRSLRPSLLRLRRQGRPSLCPASAAAHPRLPRSPRPSRRPSLLPSLLRRHRQGRLSLCPACLCPASAAAQPRLLRSPRLSRPQPRHPSRPRPRLSRRRCAAVRGPAPRLIATAQTIREASLAQLGRERRLRFAPSHNHLSVGKLDCLSHPPPPLSTLLFPPRSPLAPSASPRPSPPPPLPRAPRPARSQGSRRGPTASSRRF